MHVHAGKFSLTQLETARKNPLSFGKMLRSDSSPTKYGKSKYADWKNAIYKYHKTNNQTVALNYFDELYNRHFEARNKKNADDFEMYVKAIRAYVREHNKRDLVFVEAKKTVKIELVKGTLNLTGQVPIINLNDNLGCATTWPATGATPR